MQSVAILANVFIGLTSTLYNQVLVAHILSATSIAADVATLGES